MRAAAILAATLAAPAAAADAPPTRVVLDCSVALMTPQGQFTAPTSVTVSFTASGKALSDIRVVDAGGILYPGGNMRIVEKPGTVSLETVPVPAERPGNWSGRVDKGLYRLQLASATDAEAVRIGIARAPAKNTGRVGLVWNATHQPEGMPQPMRGSGGGNCAIAKDSQ